MRKYLLIGLLSMLGCGTTMNKAATTTISRVPDKYTNGSGNIYIKYSVSVPKSYKGSSQETILLEKEAIQEINKICVFQFGRNPIILESNEISENNKFTQEIVVQCR